MNMLAVIFSLLRTPFLFWCPLNLKLYIMFRNANGISTHTGVMKRTYDIGECCAYGTVKVHYEDNARIVVRFYNYKTNEIKESAIFSFVDKFKLRMYLEDNMTSYYADKIMEDFYA